jgi:hypothetical protein
MVAVQVAQHAVLPHRDALVAEVVVPQRGRLRTTSSS